MTAPGPIRLIPRLPPAARYAIAGCVVAMLVYAMASLDPPAPAVAPTSTPDSVIVVPALDKSILAEAKDASREQRLMLEGEPLRHLLAKAMDVGPRAAAALGAPEAMIPVAKVREELESFRHRWLWYEGVLENLSGPREGHPVRGYSIYEATIRLADGERVLAAFSHPPDAAVQRDKWVRVEGFLLKLRDATYPDPVERAPMLVGRAIQPDYEDWPPVTALDAGLLAKVDDTSFWPGDPTFHTIEEDQTEALWHLAAFVRDTAGTRTLQDWRRLPTLNAHDMHQKLVNHEVARGTPMRVFGPLIRRELVAAPTNPAGIQSWTVAWVQVREYGGGVLVPIWVPKRVDIETRRQLEVRGFFYRWLAYETKEGERRRVPLFVAADLDTYELQVDKTMGAIGMWLGGIVCLLLLLVVWAQRRAARSALQHSRDMDARRRRHRDKVARPPASEAAPR